MHREIDQETLHYRITLPRKQIDFHRLLLANGKLNSTEFRGHPEGTLLLGRFSGTPVPDAASDMERCGRPIGDVLADALPAPCPDCRGTGSYAGLASVETCRACGGRGTT